MFKKMANICLHPIVGDEVSSIVKTENQMESQQGVIASLLLTGCWWLSGSARVSQHCD